MKAKLKLLLMAGTASLGLLATACRAEAEETKAAEATEAAVEVSEAAEAPAEPPVSTEPDQPGTDPGDTNVVINQEITVLQEVPPSAPSNLNLSKGVEAIVKLAQSGVSETVILTFIETTEHEYDLDAPTILYLNDIGISSTIIAAMLNHDGAPEELKDLLEEKAELAEAPAETEPVEPISRPLLQGGYGAAQVATAPAETQVEVTTNYLPAEAQTVVQQPIVVEQPVVVQQPVVYTQPAVAHSYFYSSLSPYGSWIHVADYGWCWQPTIAVTHSGWRPYAHGGRWLYSDAGWYWQSDYTWGWAPFHYGRWFSAPHRGWVWVPDYTWGPSWVTWRRTPSYCGWAPLPPRAHYRPGFGFSYFGRSVGFDFHFGLGYEHYSFVHKRDFCDRRLVHRITPTARAINIYKESTVINNYVVGNNNTIINRGVDRDVIARHARTEIPKVGIRDLPAQPGRLVQPDRLRKQGSELVVFRPTPPSSTLAATAARAESGRQEVRRGPANSSELVRPQSNPIRPATVGTPTGRAAAFGRSEVPRSALAANTSSPQVAAPSRTVPTQNRTATTWAKPAPFVPPPVEQPAARTTARTETGRSTLYNRSAIGGNGLVTSSPTRNVTPITRPSPAPASPAPTGRSALAGQSAGGWSARSSNSPWTARTESITRNASPAPSQSATRPLIPSRQNRFEVSRPSTPSLGNSPVPGSNVGTPSGRAGIYGSSRSAPAPVTAPTSRAVAPPSQSSRTPFNNPVTVRSAPVYVPQTPTRPIAPPVSAPAVAAPRQESISRPTMVPQTTGRATSPLYHQSGRAASPVYQPRSAPAAAPTMPSRAPSRFSAPPARSAPSVAPSQGRAPTGRGAIYGSSSSAPPATGRGRMEIRR